MHNIFEHTLTWLWTKFCTSRDCINTVQWQRFLVASLKFCLSSQHTAEHWKPILSSERGTWMRREVCRSCWEDLPDLFVWTHSPLGSYFCNNYNWLFSKVFNFSFGHRVLDKHLRDFQLALAATFAAEFRRALKYTQWKALCSNIVRETHKN